MKKRWILSFGFSAIIAAIAVTGPASAQQKFDLRWAHYLPNGPFLAVEEAFAKRVADRTDGKVKLSIAYSSALGSPQETLALVGRGAVDLAAIPPGYQPDKLLYWKASQIPFIFDTPGEVIDVFQKLRSELPVFNEELDKLGVRLVLHQPLGSLYLSGPRDGCESLAGLSGKKIRSFGADVPKIVAAAGATPISNTTPEQYESLQRGTLDYSFSDIGNVAALKLYEVGKYTCGPVMSFGGHIVVMSKRTWDRLPAEYQKVITEEASVAQKQYIEWLSQNSEKAIQTIKDAGGVVKPFSAEDLTKWRSAAPDLLQGWVDDMERRGEGDRAKEVAARWRALIE